jgi:hypothetical protein
MLIVVVSEGFCRSAEGSRQKGMSLLGPSLHFAATQQFRRFRSEADIQRGAITAPDL